jgi:nitrogen-specific signal transduction histidine kinase/CheY-like chemotaxis protein
MQAAEFITHFKQSRSLIILTDKKGTIAAVNPAVYSAFDLPVEQADDIRWSNLLRKEDFLVLVQHIQSVYTTGHAFPLELMVKDQPYRFTVDLLDACDDACIIMTGRHNAFTLDRIEQRYLTRSMRDMADLTNRVAHDMNNVLSGALGFSSFLKTRVEPGSDMYKQLGLIEASAVRGHEITKSLLDFSRRRNETGEHVELHGVLAKTCQEIEAAQGTPITIEITKTPPPLPGSERKIRTALANILRNACEAAASVPHPEVSVKLDCRPLMFNEQFLFSRENDQREYAVIAVTDNGNGVYEKLRHRMIIPYVTSKQVGENAGLGLAVAFTMIDDHEGVMHTEHLGKGTRVTVYLPCRDIVAAKQKAKRAIPTSSTLQGDETILTIDDEPIIRSMMADVLPRFGYTALTAEGGKEGLNMLREKAGEIDLVMLDLNMPGLSGEETFEEIRKISTAIPVVIFSGYIAPDVQEGLEARGVKGFIHKPFKNMELLFEIRDILNASKTKPEE